MNPEEFLKSKNIEYVLHEHPAVYTCEEAEKYCGSIPGITGKNLLLRDKNKTRYFLAILPAKKKADLKKFAELVGVPKVTFASPEDLKELLGLEPGAVSPFGLLNDHDKKVELYIDNDMYNADIVSFHPNINTASLEISQEMFHGFLEELDRKVNILEL